MSSCGPFIQTPNSSSDAAAALVIVSKPGSRVVERVDEHERQCPGSSSAGDVSPELECGSRVLWNLKRSLDSVLEGKVERLCGEVTQHVGQVSSPERVDSFRGEYSPSTGQHAIVRLVQTTLLDHLILVLHPC